MFALNTLSLMAVTKAALKGMLKRRSGRIVVVRSPTPGSLSPPVRPRCCGGTRLRSAPPTRRRPRPRPAPPRRRR